MFYSPIYLKYEPMSMRRHSLSLLSLLVLSLAGQTAQAETGIVQSPAYKQCIGLASSNPAQALARAEEWLSIDNGIAAHHCRAMALYGLHRYTEAGDALNTLRGQIPSDNLALRCFVAQQAAASWRNAGRPDAAQTVLDTQIAEMNQAYGNNATNAKLTAGLLLERARLNLAQGKAKMAAKDLDHAISLTPVNPELLVERARAFQAIGDEWLARADIEGALTINPGHAAARTMLATMDAKHAQVMSTPLPPPMPAAPMPAPAASAPTR